MWPSTGNALERGGVVAHGCMNGSIACHAAVETGTHEREHTTLTAASDSQFLAVPFGQRGYIVDGADCSGEDALVGHLVAIVEVCLPISAESTVVQSVIHFLFHSYWNAVNTNLQGDDTL